MNIYLADASSLKSGDAFNKYYNEMTSDRQTKIDRCRNDKDKRLSLCAGILLKRAFEDAGKENLLSQITVSEKGRPCLFEDAGIDFNISHSGNMAMCVISDNPIGCDIQLMKPTDGKIADRHFSVDEKEYIFSSEDTSELCDRFYRIWVMKEAYTKLTGEGITRPFDSFDVLKMNIFWEKRIDDYRLCAAGIDSETEIALELVEI